MRFPRRYMSHLNHVGRWRACLSLATLQIAAACLSALLPQEASAQRYCSTAAQNCRALLQPGCADLLSAPAARVAEDPICDREIKDYRGCMAAVNRNCSQTPPPGARAIAPKAQDMMAAWAVVKDSGDPQALDEFAQEFRGAPLAVLASVRAAAIRKRNREEKLARDAQSVWRHIKNTENPQTLETFAKVFRGHQLADQALAMASELRRPPAPLANAARWRTGPAVTDTPLVNREPSPRVDSAELAEKARADAARNRAAQKELARLGYDVGRVDGAFGPRTRKALMEFQRAQGQTPDGRLTPAALDALRAAPNPPALQEPQEELAFTPTPRSDATRVTPTPDQLDANISWTILRGNDKIQGECSTALIASGPVNDEGARTYSAEEQRCEAADVTYELVLDGQASFVTGDLQIMSYNGRTRKITFRGRYPNLKSSFLGSYVTLNLAQPKP